LSHSTSPFCVGYFQDWVLRTICPSWLWTAILLISAPWIARITGMSHQCLALFSSISNAKIPLSLTEFCLFLANFHRQSL
jgi:hypothetical protein